MTQKNETLHHLHKLQALRNGFNCELVLFWRSLIKSKDLRFMQITAKQIIELAMKYVGYKEKA